MSLVSTNEINEIEIFALILNSVNMVLFCFSAIFPQKIAIWSVITLIYSVVILVLEPQNNMGLFMFFLAIIILYARGFYNKHKKIKNIISISIFCGLVFSEIRFGLKIFLNAFVEKLGYSFVLWLSFFFVQTYMIDLFKTNNSIKKLDLKKYPKLKLRDAKWLAAIINKTKYEVLAIESKMTIGSVKNRLKIVFDVLEVGDKQGFLNKYSEYKIYYGRQSFSFSEHK